MASKCDLGVTGLATMGANLARNAARKGFGVAVHNRTGAKTDALVREHGGEGTFVAAYGTHDFVAALERPRAVLMMVKAGKPVDDVIAEIAPQLEPGDILIDGGNSLFTDTQRRAGELEARGIRYLGAGVSGGEEGALEGPSIMPGGDPDAYERVRPIFERMSAHVDGTPCCTYIGPGGAGHYVKMVHNGIEYADMQLIAEAYDILSTVFSLDAARIADIFTTWKDGDLDSYLIEITASVLRKTDAASGKALVDVIVDQAEQKGTGRWTVQQALEMGVPTTAIAEAVFARSLSAARAQRVAASKLLEGPPSQAAPAAEPAAIDAIRDALYASKIVAYAQGFEQMTVASEQFGWNLDLGAIATIWRGGCIIRAKFLDRIKETYASGHPSNLLLAPYFREGVVRCEPAWRQTVELAVRRGIAVPAFTSALAYYDGYRRERSPARLIQGLRDYFGAHTYRRTDKPGSFHVRWAQDGVEVKTAET